MRGSTSEYTRVFLLSSKSTHPLKYIPYLVAIHPAIHRYGIGITENSPKHIDKEREKPELRAQILKVYLIHSGSRIEQGKDIGPVICMDIPRCAREN